MKRLSILLCLAACDADPAVLDPPTVIRSVYPPTVEIGEKLVVEPSADLPLEPGTPVKVTLARFSLDEDGNPDPIVELAGHTAGVGGTSRSNRVLVDIDRYVEEQVGGHRLFYGRVLVTYTQAGKEITLDSGDNLPVQLDFFPKTVRKLAYGLVADKQEGQLLGDLGLRVLTTRRGLEVLHVRRAWSALAMVTSYDCGIWDVARAECRAPLDGKVHLGELLRGQPPERQEELKEQFFEARGGAYCRREWCKWMNRETRDMYIDRHTGHEREDSPAAAAGIDVGDVVQAAVTGAPRLVVDEKGKLTCDPADACRVLTTPETLVNEYSRGGTLVTLAVTNPEGRARLVQLPHYGNPTFVKAAGLPVPAWMILASILVGAAMLVILPVPIIGGLIVVWERKIAGRMQSRPGPNRVGPGGWLQWLADGLKLIVKEDLVPTEADPILFRLSPYLVFTGVFATFVVMPVSQMVIIADLNIGVLYLLSVTSLVVVGIIMGGWASNSKWSLLGGMRSAAQIISYELPASIAILSVVVLSGTLSTQGLVLNQGGAPWNWHLFDNPFTFACFFIFFISALAEGNRTPFDLPEAESELVAGYNTEYSGFRFSIYFLAEWVNLVVIGSVATTVFLGGWRIPGLSPLEIEASGWLQAAAAGVFFLKVLLLVFVIIWVRWTLPRFRVDQMMNMCWKYFLPISLASFIFVAGWVWLAPYPSLARKIMRFAMFGVFGIGPLLFFIQRVNHTRKTTKMLDLRGSA